MFGSNPPPHECCGCNQQQQQQQQPGASSASRPRHQHRRSVCYAEPGDSALCSCQQAPAAAAAGTSSHRLNAARSSWPPATNSLQPPPPLPPPKTVGQDTPTAAAAASGSGCRWSGDDVPASSGCEGGFQSRRAYLAACSAPCECLPAACAPLPVDPGVTGRAGLAQHALMGLYGPPEHLRHHSGLIVRHPTESKYGFIVPLCVCSCGQFVQGRNGVLLKCRSMLG